jgi:hypothetical protein
VRIPQGSETIFRFLLASDVPVNLFWVRNALPSPSFYSFTDTSGLLAKSLTVSSACEAPNTTWYMRVGARNNVTSYNLSVTAVGEFRPWRWRAYVRV